jgi:hypothetical protein
MCSFVTIVCSHSITRNVFICDNRMFPFYYKKRVHLWQSYVPILLQETCSFVTIVCSHSITRRVWRCYVPLVINTSRSFPHSWFITGFVPKLTRRVPLVEQELLILLEHLSSLFVLFRLALVLSVVLWATLYQGNPDRNHKLWNFLSTERYIYFICRFCWNVATYEWKVPKIFPTNKIARNKICSADLLNGHDWRKVGCVVENRKMHFKHKFWRMPIWSLKRPERKGH